MQKPQWAQSRDAGSGLGKPEAVGTRGREPQDRTAGLATGSGGFGTDTSQLGDLWQVMYPLVPQFPHLEIGKTIFCCMSSEFCAPTWLMLAQTQHFHTTVSVSETWTCRSDSIVSMVSLVTPLVHRLSRVFEFLHEPHLPSVGLVLLHP